MNRRGKISRRPTRRESTAVTNGLSLHVAEASKGEGERGDSADSHGELDELGIEKCFFFCVSSAHIPCLIYDGPMSIIL